MGLSWQQGPRPVPRVHSLTAQLKSFPEPLGFFSYFLPRTRRSQRDFSSSASGGPQTNALFHLLRRFGFFLARSRCAACFARFPQMLMLHQRRACLWV
jgi:hypothetical protein